MGKGKGMARQRNVEYTNKNVEYDHNARKALFGAYAGGNVWYERHENALGATKPRRTEKGSAAPGEGTRMKV